ncbi:hypothetical protein Mterra_00094 [Calidithermus terrae]|uniref:Uncharacterized protein n=1 Tax=Calidithermus terrae TaxID=1408545 RepID=A0A399F488_9DEIN|nr:hypothetical protein [Calidithermus terrae]RIH90870.1 hypothetical protein Mterra_00094 [Calidithermus terrae]
MIKRGLLCLMVVLSTAFAFDLQQINRSRSALVGAINGVLEGGEGSWQYVPGVGLVIASRNTGDARKADALVPILRQVLLGLGTTVQGLDPEDWIVLAYRNDALELVIRVKPGRADSLEVFIDGKKQ